MSWQEPIVVLIVVAAVAWLVRRALSNSSRCSGCPKCQAETEPRRLTQISTPRNDGS